MNRIIRSTLLLSLITGTSLLAQTAAEETHLTTDPQQLTASGEIVVTAAALPERVENTTAAVTVISREQIEQRRARDLATLLREVPGLTLSRTGSEGKTVSLFTRGSASTQTVVLWNGVKLNNPYFSGYDYGQLPTAGIQQIEVVRGPYSALYGSDAMAGVINVLSAPRGNDADLDLQVGERGLISGNLDGSFVTGDLSLLGALTRRSDDGFAPNDDYEQNAASAGLTWRPGNFSVGVQARFNDFELGIPFNVNAAGTDLVPSLDRRQSGDERQLAIPLRHELGRFAWEANLSETKRSDEFTDPQDPFGLTDSDTDSLTRRLQGSVRLSTAAGVIIVGGDAERSRVDDASTYGTNLDRHRRNGNAFFVEDRFSRRVSDTSRFDLNVGVRYDSFEGCAHDDTSDRCVTSDLGSNVAPRLGAAYTFGSNKIRASYGEGFRAPSVGELYFPFSGNTNLDPEQSWNWEVGFDRFVSARTNVGVTFFDSRYRDLITFDNASFSFGNIGRARSRGLELGGRTSFGGLRVNAAYTYLDAKQEASDDCTSACEEQPLLRRPKHSGSLALNYEIARAVASLFVQRSGAREDIIPVFPYSRIENDAYTTADVMVEYRFGKLTPYVRVENLTDEKYQEVYGYASGRRRALVGVRYTVK